MRMRRYSLRFARPPSNTTRLATVCVPMRFETSKPSMRCGGSASDRRLCSSFTPGASPRRSSRAISASTPVRALRSAISMSAIFSPRRGVRSCTRRPARSLRKACQTATSSSSAGGTSTSGGTCVA